MTRKSYDSFVREIENAFAVIHRGLFKKQPLLKGIGELSFIQGIILELLQETKKLKMHEIAKAMNVSLPGATKTINKLHKLRMVKRTYNKKDRRVIYVSLTPAGIKMAQKLMNSKKKLIKHLFSKLSERERDQYLKIIRKMKRAINDEK